METARRAVRLWFDPEADYFEVLFEDRTPGYFRETADDRVMKKVDATGRVLGFSVLGASSFDGEPLEVALAAEDDGSSAERDQR